jgi:hypothetical protein
MKTVKILFGFLPGVSVGMWLRAVWFCVALCVCNPADGCPVWVFVAVVVNVMAAGVAVGCDRERWKTVGDNLNNI